MQVAYISQAPDFTGFNDPAKAQGHRRGQYDNGADVVYHAAGGSGSGLFQAAVEKNKLAIGVDSDQYQTATGRQKPLILTSALKGVDTAVYNFIEDDSKGKFNAGFTRFSLKDNGVGYATSNPKIDPYKAKIEDFKAKIISARSRCRPPRRPSPNGPGPAGADDGPGSAVYRAPRAVVPGSVPTRAAAAGACAIAATSRPRSRRPQLPHRRSSCTASPSGSPASSPTTTSTSSCGAATSTPIVGENGAGKSTLMKTLYGMHKPDEGTISVDGRPVSFSSPADAIAAGIGMVHQHFMLADNLTVLENIVLGSEPTRAVSAWTPRRPARKIDGDLGPVRPRDRSGRPGRGTRRRRAAARRDLQGALPRAPGS